MCNEDDRPDYHPGSVDAGHQTNVNVDQARVDAGQQSSSVDAGQANVNAGQGSVDAGQQGSINAGQRGSSVDAGQPTNWSIICFQADPVLSTFS